MGTEVEYEEDKQRQKQLCSAAGGFFHTVILNGYGKTSANDYAFGFAGRGNR
jgi:hypothetical protein